MFLHAGRKAQDTNTDADKAWADRRVRHVGSRSSAEDFLENQLHPAPMSRRRKIAVILLCFIFLSVAASVAVTATMGSYRQSRSDAANMADLYSTDLSHSVDDSWWTGSFFGSVIQEIDVSNNNASDNLNDIAESLIAPETGLRSMAICVQGQIRYLYSCDNLSTDAFRNIMNHTDSSALMETASQSESAVLSDLITVDGKSYFVMYIPVNDVTSYNDVYGYSVLLISFPKILETDSLNLIDSSGYDITVEAFNNGDWSTIYTSADTGLKAPMQSSTTICDQTWRISMAPRSGWIRGDTIFRCLILPFLVAIIVISVGLLFLRIRSERETAEYYAMYDSLTGVQNRQALRKNFDRLASKTGTLFVMLIDLDNFKSVNDIHGHTSGDTCLANVGKALRSMFPPESCFRYGGDEFLLITRETDRDAFDAKISAFMDTYQSLSNDSGLATTLSAGYVFGSCSSISDLRKMIYQADVSLYDIKKSFKGKVHGRPYDPDAVYQDFEQQNEHERKRKKYISDTFRTALKNKWIHVVYQPILRSLTDRLAYVEALSRWNDPEKGLISPEEFIPVLAQSFFITDLDLYVIEQVCSDFRREADLHCPAVSTSINLAYNDLRDPAFVGKIIEIADRYQVPHHNLCFEVKEEAGSSGDILRQRMRELRNNGFRVWLDDFGSEYSSLKGLQLLQIDLVKLDVRFLDNLPGYANDRQHIEAMIGMLKELGVQVLAERVENDFEKEVLVSSGCGLLQGYYCARPVSEDMLITEWLSDPKRVENPESHKYYTDISRTDILHPKFEIPDSEFPDADTLAMAIIEVRDDNTYRIISENESFRAAKTHTLQKASRMIGSQEDNWNSDFTVRLMRVQALCAAHPDTWQNMDFVTSIGDYCIARVHYLASDPSAGVTALSFVTLNLRMYSQSGTRLTNLPPDAAGRLGVVP